MSYLWTIHRAGSWKSLALEVPGGKCENPMISLKNGPDIDASDAYQAIRYSSF